MAVYAFESGWTIVVKKKYNLFSVSKLPILEETKLLSI